METLSLIRTALAEAAVDVRRLAERRLGHLVDEAAFRFLVITRLVELVDQGMPLSIERHELFGTNSVFVDLAVGEPPQAGVEFKYTRSGQDPVAHRGMLEDLYKVAAAPYPCLAVQIIRDHYRRYALRREIGWTFEPGSESCITPEAVADLSVSAQPPSHWWDGVTLALKCTDVHDIGDAPMYVFEVRRKHGNQAESRQ